MLGWVSSWWVDEKSVTVGPARNVPSGNIDIRKFFEQKATQVMIISSEELQDHIRKLRPTVTNAQPPLSSKPPLMQEMEDLCRSQIGEEQPDHRAILAALRRKRQKPLPRLDNEHSKENSQQSEA